MSFAAFLLVLLGVGYAVGDRHCDGIDPQNRLDCGYFGITKDECVNDRHCCFDDTDQSVPWCFRGKLDLGDKCRSIDVKDRNDCGWIGITKETCEGRGCCYDDRGYDMNSKYCFYPKGKKCYGIAPGNRQDCGYYGIQRDECERDRGCCFDHTVLNVPWCFVGHYHPTPVPTTEGPTEGSGVGPSEGTTTEPTTEPPEGPTTEPNETPTTETTELPA